MRKVFFLITCLLFTGCFYSRISIQTNIPVLGQVGPKLEWELSINPLAEKKNAYSFNGSTDSVHRGFL